MNKYARNLYVIISLITIIGVIFLIGKCDGQRKAKQAYHEDTLKISYEKRVLVQKKIVREQEKQLRLLEAEKKKLSIDVKELKKAVSSTLRTSKHKPVYIYTSTDSCVTDSSYQALKNTSKTIEKQRNEAIIMLDECQLLSSQTDTANSIQKQALEAIIEKNNTLIATNEKEAKKAKKLGIWKTIKTVAVTIAVTLSAIAVATVL